jgi:sialic acid synthase SpsE
VNFLVNECNPAFIKIASMDLNNYLFLKFIAKKKVPVILSTGMGTIKEIENAVKLLISNGQKNICILHCVSLYPLDSKIANLKNITMLRNKFKNIPIGYSDHSIGNTLPISSVALGACVVEKHFTLDSKKIGMDNQMATEPNDMQKLTSECLIAFNSLGAEKRILSKQEFDQRKKMRRSIFHSCHLKKMKKLQ